MDRYFNFFIDNNFLMCIIKYKEGSMHGALNNAFSFFLFFLFTYKQ